ncbi:MAG: 3-deoxy-manno-octulosonate cytidylyltransferase [Cyanobacteria bacterium SIG28]|nr:3-deoxy-manno-octulosonate cytidylyltransferase [Cyanobacteria bacterium SIG28]
MENNQTAIIIPARYGSSRLEGKPLLKACNKPIIQWVWEKAKACPLVDRVIVATDDDRIYNACKEFGAEVEMTSTEHKSGSDRIAEVAHRHPEIGYIINLQGDEPLIEQANIELVIKGVKNDEKADISTLVREINDVDEVENPNLVKCVFDVNSYAMYFSRSKIPFERNIGKTKFYGHLGIYGFKREALFKMTQLSQTTYEMAESLEQLRALQNGMKIKVSTVANVPVGIDTMEDFEKFKSMVEA